MLLSPSRAMVVGWPLRHHLKLVGRKWMIIQFIIQTSEGFKCIPSKIFAGVFPLSRCCFFCLVAWLSRRSSSYLHIFMALATKKAVVVVSLIVSWEWLLIYVFTFKCNCTNSVFVNQVNWFVRLCSYMKIRY